MLSHFSNLVAVISLTKHLVKEESITILKVWMYLNYMYLNYMCVYGLCVIFQKRQAQIEEMIESVSIFWICIYVNLYDIHFLTG